MSNQDMITAIINAINPPANNLETLLILMITNNIQNVPTQQLQAMCAALNIPTS